MFNVHSGFKALESFFASSSFLFPMQPHLKPAVWFDALCLQSKKTAREKEGGGGCDQKFLVTKAQNLCSECHYMLFVGSLNVKQKTPRRIGDV